MDGQCLTSSNTSMKVFPMIFLLVSGSVTPASLPRKRSLASTRCRLMPILCVGVDTMRPHVIAESDTSGLGEQGRRVVKARCLTASRVCESHFCSSCHVNGGHVRVSPVLEPLDHLRALILPQAAAVHLHHHTPPSQT